MERKLKTTNSRHNGEKVPEEVKALVIESIKAGHGIVATAQKLDLAPSTVTAIRNAAEDADPELGLSLWKRSTAATLRHFVSRGAERLVSEIEQIPLANLPIALAVCIDKIQALNSEPQVVVQHRLMISHDDLKSMLDSEGVVLDAELVSQPTEKAADSP